MKSVCRNLALIAGLFFMTSCYDHLEEDLKTSVTADSYYETPSGFEDAVNATYMQLRTWYGRQSGWTMTDFGTDIFTNGFGGGHKGFNFYDARLNAQEGFLQDLWDNFYKGINQANAVIGRADGVPGLDEEVKNERIAEVRFLRALFYFNLVRTYGDIHLSLEETQGVQTEASRAPTSEIYSQAIIPDLEFAINNLPPSQDGYGRATKPAAQHLLALVLLTRGYEDFTGSDDFTRSAQLAESVINDYGFSLLDNWEDVFDINNQQHNEVVWSIQYTQDQLLNGEGNSGHLYFLMQYDIEPGMKRDTQNGRPWVRFRPTIFLTELWDRDRDVRYEHSFKDVFLSNNANSIPTDGNGNNLFSMGDTALYLPGHSVSQEIRESKPYKIITPQEYNDRLYPTLAKHLDPLRPSVNATEGSRDVMVMRLAGTHLLVAEAYFQAGNIENAAEHLNIVRRRSAKTGMEDEMEITTGDVDLDFILDERARELAGEMHRWFTLTRTDKLLERVKAHNPQGGPNIQSYHSLRPIPQTQIDRTEGGYDQNEGY